MTTHGIGHNSGDARPFNENSAPQRADTKPTPDAAKPIAPKPIKSVRQGHIKPKSQSDDELAASAQRHLAAAAKHERINRKEIYLAVADFYRIYEKNYPNEHKREKFKRTMSDKKLPMKKFELAIFVVRYFGKINDNKTVSRYAGLLRKAHYANVEPEGMVGYIRNQMDKLSKNKTDQPKNEKRNGKATDAHQNTKRNQHKTERAHHRQQTASSKSRATLILENDREQKFHKAEEHSTFWIRVRKADNQTARAREVRFNSPFMTRSERKRAHH